MIDVQRAANLLLAAELLLIALFLFQFLVVMPILLREYSQTEYNPPIASQAVFFIPARLAIAVALAAAGLCFMKKWWIRLLVCCMFIGGNAVYFHAIHAPMQHLLVHNHLRQFGP